MTDKVDWLQIGAEPGGGYSVWSPTNSRLDAAFTTIDEALRYIRREMLGEERVPDPEADRNLSAFYQQHQSGVAHELGLSNNSHPRGR